MPDLVDHPRELIGFAGFELDSLSGEIRKGDSVVRLQPQTLKLLLALLRRPGELLSREELKQELMPDAAYGDFDHAINLAVSKLRAALNDSPEHPRFIETLPRRGYRFIADTLDMAPSQDELATLPAGQTPAPGPAVRPRRGLWSVAFVTALLLLTFTGSRTTSPGGKDSVLVADISNETGDAVFTETLREALVVQLSQSPLIGIVSDHDIMETLRQMRRTTQEAVVGEIAREVCIRSGSSAYVTGSITRIGNRYVPGSEVVDCSAGNVIVQQQTRVAQKEEVLDTLDKQSSVIRSQLGESLRSIQKLNVPVAQATTSSLEALQAYSLAAKASRRDAR